MERAEKRGDQAGLSQTDWKRINAMTDADIQRGIDSDPDSAPALSFEDIKSSYRPSPARIKR